MIEHHDIANNLKSQSKQRQHDGARRHSESTLFVHQFGKFAAEMMNTLEGENASQGKWHRNQRSWSEGRAS